MSKNPGLDNVLRRIYTYYFIQYVPKMTQMESHL